MTKKFLKFAAELVGTRAVTLCVPVEDMSHGLKFAGNCPEFVGTRVVPVRVPTNALVRG